MPSLTSWAMARQHRALKEPVRRPFRHPAFPEWFAAELDRRTGAGADPVLAAFDTLDDWARSPGFRGCAFLNTLAEPTEIDESHRALIADHKRALVELLADSAAAAHPDAPGARED